MELNFFMGKPHRNGDYVVYIQDRTQPEWMRPIILHWHDGTWYYPKADTQFKSGVFGWHGPLPVGKLTDPIPPAPLDFDL